MIVANKVRPCPRTRLVFIWSPRSHGARQPIDTTLRHCVAFAPCPFVPLIGVQTPGRRPQSLVTDGLPPRLLPRSDAGPLLAQVEATGLLSFHPCGLLYETSDPTLEGRVASDSVLALGLTPRSQYVVNLVCADTRLVPSWRIGDRPTRLLSSWRICAVAWPPRPANERRPRAVPPSGRQERSAPTWTTRCWRICTARRGRGMDGRPS